jgi:hypothetical protein
MICAFRRFAAGLLVALGFSLPASAASTGIDFTDLWYNPSESGWGVNLIQQNNIIFATLFVYGTDNSPRWFVASNLQGGGTTFTGQLFQTTGAAFSAPWNPAALTNTPVGTMTLAFNSATTGTLSYTVNGTPVTKQIQRQTWSAENFSGKYIGGLTAQGTNCQNSPNGPILIFDLLTVTHSVTSFSARVDFNNANNVASVCTFTGTYGQDGHLGKVNGNFSCTFGSTPGNVGTFNMSQMAVTQNGFSAAFSGSDQFCTYSGFFGGVRDVL